jgi:hypothetical protein
MMKGGFGPAQEGEPRRCDEALQGHLRRYRDRGDDDQRAQITAAEQHQRARGAGIRRDHAVAEHDAAKKHQRRRERRLQVNRLAQIDEAADCKRLGAGDGDRYCQCETADHAAVALGPPVAQAAGQAKAADKIDRAKDKADGEG